MTEAQRIAELFRQLTPAQRMEALAALSDEEASLILHDWDIWARPKQREPESLRDGLKSIWLILAGRGFGKTRTGSETINKWAREVPGCDIVIIAPTAADCRDTCTESESGILGVSPPWFMPKYEPSKARITWPNGTRAFLVSGDEPERLRGKNSTFFWFDELAAVPRQQECWDNLVMGWRIGKHPKGVVTTTPRPTKLVKELAAREDVELTTGSSMENLENLAPTFVREVIERYKGTRLGMQELEAAILSDNPSALWKPGIIEPFRISNKQLPTMERIVVGVDPAVTDSANSDETGIVVCGQAMCSCKGEGNEEMHFFVLEDASLKGSPKEWSDKASEVWHKWQGDKVVAEANQGHDLVLYTMRSVDPAINVSKVIAKKGKLLRAEPVAGLYEQGKVHHLNVMEHLEAQMTEYSGGRNSPDRLDAMVYALLELAYQGRVRAKPRAYFAGGDPE